MTKKAKNKKQQSDLELILINILIQAAVFIVSILFSFTLGLKKEYYFLVALLSICLGNFLSGFVSGRAKKQKGLVFGVLYSVGFNLILLFASLILNSFSLDYITVITLALPLVFSCAGGIIAVNLKRNTVRH